MNPALLREPRLIPVQGSAVQLPSYNLSKSLLVDNGWAPNSYLTYFVASAVSGLCVLTAMQPADTVLTRMYNRTSSERQGRESANRLGREYRQGPSNGQDTWRTLLQPYRLLVEDFEDRGNQGMVQRSVFAYLRLVRR